VNDQNSDRPRDVLDEIDDAVAQITAANIEDRLRETLRRASYAPSRPVGEEMPADSTVIRLNPRT
jgi:hypothetical protein